MTDSDISATIDRHRQHSPGAANDLIRFAAEIDRQRGLANELASQSERLRNDVARLRAALGLFTDQVGMTGQISRAVLDGADVRDAGVVKDVLCKRWKTGAK